MGLIRSIPAAFWMRIAVSLFFAMWARAATADTAAYRPLLVRGGQVAALPVQALSSDTVYSVLISLPALAGLDVGDRFDVTVEDAAGPAYGKRLHPGDADLAVILRPRRSGAGNIRVQVRGAADKTYTLRCSVTPLRLSGSGDVIVAAGPNHTWHTAQPIELGKTVFASNDERPYIPPEDGPEAVFAAMLAGAQWYTFTHAGDAPILVHFTLDVLDRDIPCDVALFIRESQDGRDRLTPYEEGVERYIIEQSTTFHGLNKMIARVLKPGTYYLRVMGNHPAYQLRTNVYEPPPYLNAGVSREEAAARAIRVGMDYLLSKGDSWHANTPRKGGIVLRTSNALQETQLCIACHPTHFTTRAAMVAAENGWPVKQRSALKFLTERLYNNPRPLYGEPDTAWVRVISAPGNVTSRMAYMEMEFEKYISSEQRAGIMDDLGNLLERYWSGMTQTIDESNGNLPRVSGFEIALHSRYVFDELHRRTGKQAYLELRDRAEKVALDSTPIDMLDLCWQAVALASADRAKYASQIRELIERIFAYQKADGTFSMVFDTKIVGYDYNSKKHTETKAPLDPDGTPRTSEFQTYHCLYALAKCGVTPGDPRLARTLDWCLSRQQPHGAWQGNADFKNFDTTFRETQYAVMALSELFKGPGSRGWYAGFAPPPAEIHADSVDEFLSAVDRYWETPPPAVLERLRAALGHQQPLVREAAAACLGRVADAGSLPALIARLGDDSKLVQRAAAWAVREIATRRETGHELILAALQSGDDRTRWGAMRIFNQHFRSLAPSGPLLSAAIERMNRDPVPAIRMAAAQSLARWWFWLREPDRQQRIEHAFLDRLAQPENAWVRRNLIEGLRNILDDNTRYLYNTWIPALKRPEDRRRVEAAHQRHVSEQAARVARVLVGGNALQRDGILRSFYTFHLHEPGGDPKRVEQVPMPETYVHPEPAERGQNKWIDGYKAAATYDPLTMGTGSLARLGNDSEPPDFRGDAAASINRALAALLEKDASSGLAVLKTIKHLRSLPLDDALSAALLRLALHAPAGQAAEIRRLLRELLPSRMGDGESILTPMAELIASGEGEALVVAGEVLTQPARSTLVNAQVTAHALSERLADMPPDDPDLATLVEAATHLTALAAEEPLVDKIFAVAGSSSAGTERVLRMMLRSPAFLAAGEPRKRFERMLRQATPGQLLLLLKEAGAIDYSQKGADLSAGLALGIVTTALGHPQDDVRTAALDAVRSIAPIQSNPGVVSRVRELAAASLGGASAESARALLASMNARHQVADQDPAELLDFEYFVQNIQPILSRPGEDRFACVTCHANHSIFKLNEPDIDGRFTPEQLRENYRHALKVVDLGKPEKSLILRKPTSPFDGIGVPGSYARTHGGDVRWSGGADSQEYRTILKWLQGARTQAGTQPTAAAGRADAGRSDRSSPPPESSPGRPTR